MFKWHFVSESTRVMSENLFITEAQASYIGTHRSLLRQQGFIRFKDYSLFYGYTYEMVIKRGWRRQVILGSPSIITRVETESFLWRKDISCPLYVCEEVEFRIWKQLGLVYRCNIRDDE